MTVKEQENLTIEQSVSWFTKNRKKISYVLCVLAGVVGGNVDRLEWPSSKKLNELEQRIEKIEKQINRSSSNQNEPEKSN